MIASYTPVTHGHDASGGIILGWLIVILAGLVVRYPLYTVGLVLILPSMAIEWLIKSVRRSLLSEPLAVEVETYYDPMSARIVGRAPRGLIAQEAADYVGAPKAIS
jgi:hypothetical protein